MDQEFNQEFNEELTPNIRVDYGQINKQCCCFNMRKVSRAVTQFFDRYLEPLGIRSTQFTLLVELGSVSAKTLTEIAEGLVMDRTTLTRNLKPLEKQGLITSVPTSDKRAKAYTLTTSGKEILARTHPTWQQCQDRIVTFLGQERYGNILGELETLLSSIADEALKN